MHTETRITAADLRALIARARVPQYIVAAHARVHPVRLSAWLRETRPLSQEIGARILSAIVKAEGEGHGR